jgi:hypothetical protein
VRSEPTGREPVRDDFLTLISCRDAAGAVRHIGSTRETLTNPHGHVSVSFIDAPSAQIRYGAKPWNTNLP